MFFYLSKIFWFFVDPGNLLLIGLLIAMVLVWTRYTVLLKCWLTVLVVSALFFSVVPLGEFLLNKLENNQVKFPVMTKNLKLKQI